MLSSVPSHGIFPWTGKKWSLGSRPCATPHCRSAFRWPPLFSTPYQMMLLLIADAAVADGYTQTGRRMDPACSHLTADVVKGVICVVHYNLTQWQCMLVRDGTRFLYHSKRGVHKWHIPIHCNDCDEWSNVCREVLVNLRHFQDIWIWQVPPALPCNSYSFEMNIT